MTVGREEFDALVRRVEANAATLATSAALAVQVAEVIKDVSEVRSDLREHRSEHRQAELEAARARVSGRRWAVGLAFSGLAAVGGLYGWVALLIHR